MQWLAHFYTHFSVLILAYEGQGIGIPMRDVNDKFIYILKMLVSVKSQFGKPIS